MQLGNGIYYSTCSLKAQHVSSVTSLIFRSSNCICSLWFTYASGDRPWSSLSGNWLRYRVCCYWSSSHVCLSNFSFDILKASLVFDLRFKRLGKLDSCCGSKIHSAATCNTSHSGLCVDDLVNQHGFQRRSKTNLGGNPPCSFPVQRQPLLDVWPIMGNAVCVSSVQSFANTLHKTFYFVDITLLVYCRYLTLRLLMSYIQGVTGGRDKTSGECSLC